MLRLLEVVLKDLHQAWRDSLTFMFRKQKCYDNNFVIFIIFLFSYKRINVEGCIIAPIVATSCFCQRKATFVRGRSQTTFTRRGRQVLRGSKNVQFLPSFIPQQKMSTHGVGGQKKSQNFVNVVCERPLTPKFQATRETLPPSWKTATMPLSIHLCLRVS